LHPGRSEILSSFLVGKELFDRYIDRIRDLKKILTLPHTQGSFLYLFLVGLVFELRALHLQVRLLQNRHPTAYATSILFWLVLEMGSHELFAKAGLEQQSSQSHWYESLAPGFCIYLTNDFAFCVEILSVIDTALLNNVGHSWKSQVINFLS
jgi:hypothetical protein